MNYVISSNIQDGQNHSQILSCCNLNTFIMLTKFELIQPVTARHFQKKEYKMDVNTQPTNFDQCYCIQTLTNSLHRLEL